MEDNTNNELEEARAHGGFKISEVLGSVGTVGESKRKALLSLLTILSASLPAHLQAHYLPREGQDPYQSAECVVNSVVCDAALCILAAQDGEDRPKTPEELESQAEQLVNEVYQMFDVQRRNAMREAARELLFPLMQMFGIESADQIQPFMVTKDGVQPLDMRDEPL